MNQNLQIHQILSCHQLRKTQDQIRDQKSCLKNISKFLSIYRYYSSVTSQYLHIQYNIYYLITKFAKFKMARQMSQREIDALLDSSSEKQAKQIQSPNKESEAYDQEFQNQQAYDQDFQKQGDIQNQSKVKASDSPKKSVKNQAEKSKQPEHKKQIKQSKKKDSQVSKKSSKQEKVQPIAKQIKKEEQQNYSQNFQEQIQEQSQEQVSIKQAQSNQFEQEPVQQDEIIPQEEVKSEYGSQINDEINSDGGISLKKQSKIKLRDEDLSQAQSQFIDSSKLSNELNKKTKRDKQKTINKPLEKKPSVNRPPQNNAFKKQGKQGKVDSKAKINTIKLQPKKSTEKAKRNSQIGKKDLTKNIAKKDLTANENDKKQSKSKLTQQQIELKMKQIKADKARIQKTKQQNRLKQEQAKRQQYEQAKKKQEQRKQRNRLILEQQKRTAKQKSGLNDTLKKIKVAEPQQEVKLPEKKTDFKYMDMKQDRLRKQKQIKENIINDNKAKLMELNKVQPKMKFEEKKALFLQQKNDVKVNQVKQKKKQEFQVQTVQIKQIKKDITDLKRQNQQKRKQIHKFEKTIQDYMKKVKILEKQYYQDQPANKKEEKQQFYANFSQLSSVQKFVGYFSQAKTPKQIFLIFDANKDGLLSVQQISSKMKQYKVDSNIAQQVHSLLDQNSDGNVTLEQFTFIIQNQIKRQQGYRAIMGEVRIIDPLDIEAKIIDMRAEIKYMSLEIEKESKSQGDPQSESKYQKVMAKIKKIQEKSIKKKQENENKKANNPFNISPAFLLAHQVTRLQKQKQEKTKSLQQVKQAFKKLLKDKGKQLQLKVDEHLSLKHQIHKMKIDIQDTQLAMLSLRKIRFKTKGHVEWQTKIRADLDQLKGDVKSYIQKMAQRPELMKGMSTEEEQNFVAVIILVQRNFRRRHGLKNFKANKNKNEKA